MHTELGTTLVTPRVTWQEEAAFRRSTQVGRRQGTNRFWKGGEIRAAAVPHSSSHHHHRSSLREEAQTAPHLCKPSWQAGDLAQLMEEKRIATRTVSLPSIR